MRVTYTPGDWTAIVRCRTLIILPGDTGQAIVNSIWDSLAEVSSLEGALKVVTTAFGADVTGMPPFAVASLQTRLHLVVRGRITALCHQGQQNTTVSGAHVTTWNEQVLDHQDRVEIDFDPAAEEATTLPIEAGVVRTGGLLIELAGDNGGGDAGDDAAQAEVDRAPEAAAETETGAAAEARAELEPAEDTEAEAVAAEQERTLGPLAEEQSEEQPPVSELAAEPVAPASSVEDQAEVSQTTGYDHLWDQTVLRKVEDAAVRAADDDDVETEQDAGPAEVAAEEPAADVPVTGDEQSPAGTDSWIPRRGPAPDAGTGLIDSVPWVKPGSDRESASAPDSSPQPQPGPSSEPDGQPQPAPSSEPVPQLAPSEPVPQSAAEAGADDETDHDGRTVMRSELGQAPDDEPSTQESGQNGQATRGPTTGPMVLARVCPSGHANPPTNANCSTCGTAVTADPTEVRRPSLGAMRISNGDVVDLDRSVIVGRQPSVSRVQGNVMPRMVQVRSEDGDISRSHVEVRLEGWHVMLCDLNSTNGTFLIREGQSPRRLGPGEQTMLLDGDTAELGDNVWLRFEDLQ